MNARNTVFAAAAAVAALAPVAAQARDVPVPYRSFELETPAGRASVIARVERIATRACTGQGTLAERVAVKDCAAKLGGEIIAKMDSPVMTALWTGGTQVASR